MNAGREADGVKWRALAPFGVELDLDLAAPRAAETDARLRALFEEHGWLLARHQTLTMEQQQAFCSLFGEIFERPGETGYLTTVNAHSASLSELTFHADGAYTNHPFAALALHAVDVVDGASSTRFAHAERAYAALPDALRKTLDMHGAEMISPSHDALGVRACELREPAARSREELPAARTHPRSGRSFIGVSEMHTARLTGMAWEESRDTLNAVFDHLYAPGNTHAHVWRRGDNVVWDNLTYQHARGPLQAVGKRVLQRVIVGAGPPV